MSRSVHDDASPRRPLVLDEVAFRTRLALGVLVTWRVTHLIALEDGPAEIVARLRSRLGDGRLGDLMDCFQCLSVWVAAPVAMVIARGRREAFVTWLGLSGAACLLEQATGAGSVSNLTNDGGGP